MAQNISSKNKIVRHESLIPSPKTTGPRVPAENDKILTLAENHTKKILKHWVSWRSSMGMGRIPIGWDQKTQVAAKILITCLLSPLRFLSGSFLASCPAKFHSLPSQKSRPIRFCGRFLLDLVVTWKRA